MIGVSGPAPGITGWWLGRRRDVLGRVEFEEVSLSRGFHQPFPPRAKNVAAVKIKLPTQLVDGLLVFLDGLVVELRGLVQRGLEVLNLLGEPV